MTAPVSSVRDAARDFDFLMGRWLVHNRRLKARLHFGGFTGDIGVFEGDDTFEGKPIRVRFTWTRLDADHARWEQAFSADAGRTWETNWTMDFTRAS